MARGGELVRELNAESNAAEVAERPALLGHAVAATRGSGTLTRRQVEALERIVSLGAWGVDQLEFDLALRRELRFAVMRLLGQAPAIEGDLQGWIKAMAAVLNDVLTELAETPAKKGSDLIRAKAGRGACTLPFFGAPRPALRAQTVHEVKGRSEDGVLVVIDRLRSKQHGNQGQLWSSAVDRLAYRCPARSSR